MIKKPFFALPIILLISSFFVFSGAKAVVAPQIYITDLSMEKSIFKAGEAITGNATFWNYEEYIMPDVGFDYKLFSIDKDGNPANTFDAEKGGAAFTLLPDQKIAKDFSYLIPANIPSGTYLFRIQSVSGRGEIAGRKDTVVSIEGGNASFIELSNNWILKDTGDIQSKDGKVLPGTGPSYNPGEKPEVQFDIKNGSSDASVFPQIVVFKRNAEGEIAKEEKGETIQIKADEKSTKKLTLPEMSEPESYLAEVKLYDSSTSQPISNPIYFRWVISGQNDAKIISVSLDKNVYQTGETAKAKIMYAGPADPNLTPEKAALEVRLFDNNNNLVGEKTEDVDFSSAEKIMDITISSNVENPKIEVKITKDGKVVDQYSTKLDIPMATEPNNIPKEKMTIILWIILAIVLLIIFAAGFFFYKKKINNIPLFLIVILASLSFIIPAKSMALTQVVGACYSWSQPSFSISRPVPLQHYSKGDFLTIDGILDTYSCANTLNFAARIKIYITEDREIPLKECGGEFSGTANRCSWAIHDGTAAEVNSCVGTFCADALSMIGSSASGLGQFGVSSLNSCKDFTSYLTENYQPGYSQFLFWNEIKQLDQTKGYKIWDRSTFFQSLVIGPMLPGETPPIESAIHDRFQVPTDLNITGNARLYFEVAYPNLHRNASTGQIDFFFWNWVVFYQPIYIDPNPNNPPIASGLVASPSYCDTMYEGSVDFDFSYSDPDGDPQYGTHIQISENSDFSTLRIDDNIGFATTHMRRYIRSNLSNYLQLNKTYYWRVRVQDERGAWSNWYNGLSFTTPKNQYPKPIVTVNPGTPYTWDVVTFSDSTTFYDTTCKNNPGDSSCKYKWTIPDGSYTGGTSSTSRNPQFIFSSAGTKTVKLESTDSNNYTCPKNIFVNVQLSSNQPPTAIVSCSPSSCSVSTGAALAMVNNSTDPDGLADIVNTKWYVKVRTAADSTFTLVPYCPMGPCLPEPAIRNGIMPTSVSGDYTAKLVVTDSGGHTGEARKDFTVAAANQPPTSVISCSPSGCSVEQGTTITLNNNSTDPEGDGDFSRSQWYTKLQTEPDSAYVLRRDCPGSVAPFLPVKCGYSNSSLPEGNYTAKLVVTDSQNHTGQSTKNFSITSVGNHPPVAAISCTPSSCEVFKGAVILTLNNNSTDPDGITDIVDSKWYIKTQGAADSTYQSKLTCANNCNYTPQSEVGPGSYTGKLTVTDNAGASSTATKDFTVKANISGNVLCSLDGSTYSDCSNAEFKSLDIGQKVYLEDISTPSQGGSINSRIWTGQYSDGTAVSNIQFPGSDSAHVYPRFNVVKRGEINVTLNVSDTNGQSATIVKTIGSIPPPEWHEIPPFGLLRSLFSSISINL